MKNAILPTILVTLYLLTYTVLTKLDVPLNILLLLFAFWPVAVIWMVVSIMRDKSTSVRELEENEEWGYQDKENNSLGTF